MKKSFWVIVIYLFVFIGLIIAVLVNFDKPVIIAFASALAGSITGFIGSYMTSIISLQRIEKESEVRLKEFASTQALELTKLELQMRKEEGNQKQFLAAAKIYREFYKALYELYETKKWPKVIEDQGLLNIYDFSTKNADVTNK